MQKRLNLLKRFKKQTQKIISKRGGFLFYRTL